MAYGGWRGSSALLGATALCTGAGSAQAELSVTLSGNTAFGVEAATDETLSSEPDRGYGFFMDNEIVVEAEGATERGILYGAEIQLDVSAADDTSVDEQVLFFSGAFGRVELGQDDGAEDVMFLGGEDAQAGTGGIDGDTANLAPIGLQDTDDATKVTYFTPRAAGFQLGISYTPDDGDDGGGDANDDIENSFGLGANWVEVFGEVELGLATVAFFGENENDEEDDLADWAIGSLIGYGGMELGAGLIQRTKAGEADIVTVGLAYDFGFMDASVGYILDDAKGERRQNVFALSGDIGLLDGVSLNADVTYNDNDPGAEPAGRQTWAGVLKLELYY